MQKIYESNTFKMKVINSKTELAAVLGSARKDNRTVGLVPTMGALHEGHASLVRRSVSENDITVVSIFLNPTQFNDPSDLERYPRTLESDCRILEQCGAQIAFAPSVKEIYPNEDTRHFSFPPTDEVMEGARRPGHFNGVCQIVSELFMTVQPDRAYFGEKDYQQIAVIRAMVSAYRNSDIECRTISGRVIGNEWARRIEIVPCPVVREDSGLARSSRNALLAPEEKDIAPNIYRIMQESKALGLPVDETRQWVVSHINAIDGLEVEYYSIVDGDTLADVHSWDGAASIVGCITVYCGKTPIRLIDHIRYK